MTGLFIAAAVLLCELLSLTVWVDGGSLAGRPGLAGAIGSAGSWILRAAIAFAASFAVFTGLSGKAADLRSVISPNRGFPASWLALSAHLLLALSMVPLSNALFSINPAANGNLLGATWLAEGLAVVLTAALAAAPIGLWRNVAKLSGPAWIYASIVALVTSAITAASRSFWQGTAHLTFNIVTAMLAPFYSLTAQPEILRLATPRFGVIIAPECSGLEGAGLILVFLMVWLFISRRDLRFPRALLLVPAGVGILYFLNAVRIAVLIAIGDAGAPEIAKGGFHSQAGWIAFNFVAIGMTAVVPHLNWFRLQPRPRSSMTPHESWVKGNPTAAYLLPFLAIVGLGMLSRATSADFEWLYVVRFAGAAAVLCIFRESLWKMDWRGGWLGVATGLGVFIVWLGLDRLAGIPSAAMPHALATAGPWMRTTWITMRAVAAISTVPIAEELAFRGFLARRIDSPDFETLPLSKISMAGLVVSSILFGLLHGERWLAGIFAGLAFGAVARRAGRLGESVVAHAVANALLAIWVLGNNQWQYW